MRWTNPERCAIRIALRSGMCPVELADLLDVDEPSICVCRLDRIYVDEATRHGLDEVSLSWRADLSMFDEQTRARCYAWLYQQKTRQGRLLSLRDVAHITGVDHKTVSRYLENAGISRRPQRRYEHPARARLTPHLVGILRQKLTVNQIAQLYGCSVRTVESILYD